MAQKETTRTKKKQHTGKTFRSKVLRMIFLLLVIYFSYNIVNTGIGIYREKRIYDEISRKIEEQLLVRDDLNRHLNNGDDADYIEQIAREKLGYAAPDEQVFVDS